MLTFTEVVHGFENEEGIEILRLAESENQDVLSLIKNTETEEYQVCLSMSDGREGVDQFKDLAEAEETFNKVLNGQL